MPWQNDGGSGGPWGSGGGDGPKNPWGGKPKGGGGGGGGGGGNRGGPPDFDAFIRRSQERLRGAMPDGRPRLPWTLIALAAVAVWIAFTSFYRVGPQERGVVLRLGSYVATTGPGVHFKLPSPIDTVIKPPVEQVNSVDIGAPDGAGENLMLTGDQNIIDIAYAVRWKIRSPELFLFELKDPEATIKEVAEAAMRSQVGDATLNDAVGPQRAAIADQVRNRMQEIMDSYRSGVEVLGVDIKQADPPQAVDDAFKDVSAAQQQAQQYMNDARAYAQSVTARSQGDTALFNAVYTQYRLSPEVTRKRMYLETMEEVLKNVDKTVVDVDGVVPYLPLPEVQRRARAAATPPAQGGQ